MDKYQVSVAAEAIVAAQCARVAYNVSIQYGANQPGYDLVAQKGKRILKVSVKGSQDGSWNLTGTLKQGRSNSEAADTWLKNHGADMVFAFVQFQGVNLGEMPRVYVACAKDVASQLKAARKGHGNTILSENHAWKSGIAKGCIDCIPSTWAFSGERIDSV